MQKIYLDENLSQYVAEALNQLNKGYFPNITVCSTKIEFGKGAPDEFIIPKIGKEGSVMITRDFNIKRTQLQYELCKNSNIGIFFLSPTKGSVRHWDIVKLLVNYWEEIVHKVERESHPFAFKITAKGKFQKLE